MRRRIEIEIRKEMEEAAVRKEEVAKEKAEARKAQKVARNLAELASREGKAAAAAAKDAAAQRECDAAKAVAPAAEEENAAEVAERRKFAAPLAALAERADGQLRAGHAANKQGDYAKARHFFLEAHALQNKPAALISAANMALKLREASTAKREYEQVLASSGLTESVTRSTKVKLREAAAIMEKQVRDAAKLAGVSPPEIKAAEAKNQQAAESKRELAAQHIRWQEELRHLDTLAPEDVNTIALAAAITSAEANVTRLPSPVRHLPGLRRSVEQSEEYISQARLVLARAKAAQAAQEAAESRPELTVRPRASI